MEKCIKMDGDLDPRVKHEDDGAGKASLLVGFVLLVGVAWVGGTGEVLGACTSSPSCSTLGYVKTAAQCPNGGVKCPCDTTKWFCQESCGVDYAYTCVGTGYAGGSGMGCDKESSKYYASCNCASGYSWKSGSCVKDPQSAGFCCEDGFSLCNPTDVNECMAKTGLPACSTFSKPCASLGSGFRSNYGGCKGTAYFNCTYSPYNF